MNTAQHNTALIELMSNPAGAFSVPRRGRGPVWADEDTHTALCAASPARYALAALLPGVSDAHRTQVLYQLMRASRASLSDGDRELVERAARVLTTQLPMECVLTVFLALRRARINRRHASHAAVRWVVNHPDLAALLLARRPSVVHVLEHALGRNTARGALAAICEGQADARIMRFAESTEAAARLARLAPYLCRRGAPPTLTAAEEAAPAASAPGTITATNRGEIAAALVHTYRGGASQTLRAAIREGVDAEQSRLPRFGGRLGVVLDASASTRGYGDREHCIISQSVALTLVLKAVCPDLVLATTGGCGEFWAPEGITDLAEGLLSVAEQAPDVIAVITDGYENTDPGDLAAVAAALPGAGVSAPVVVCTSRFTGRDDLTFRQVAPELPQLPFWHQGDFVDLITRLLSRAPCASGEAFFHHRLLANLAEVEEAA